MCKFNAEKAKEYKDIFFEEVTFFIN